MLLSNVPPRVKWGLNAELRYWMRSLIDAYFIGYFGYDCKRINSETIHTLYVIYCLFYFFLTLFFLIYIRLWCVYDVMKIQTNNINKHEYTNIYVLFSSFSFSIYPAFIWYAGYRASTRYTRNIIYCWYKVMVVISECLARSTAGPLALAQVVRAAWRRRGGLMALQCCQIISPPVR